MSLAKINMDDTIKKLYLFKLNSYSGVFTTLIFLQIISIISI